jgi:hypothetical protein
MMNEVLWYISGLIVRYTSFLGRFYSLLCLSIEYSSETGLFKSEIRIFPFLSNSPDLLRSVCGLTAPISMEMQWNFQNNLMNLYTNMSYLLECFDIMQNENGWNDNLARESVGLIQLLNDKILLYYLFFFVICRCSIQNL